MYGGYGGYSGLGSTYGSYGSYGGLGSSYGGLSSSYGRGYGNEYSTRQSQASGKEKVENEDPNKPADPQQQQQQQQDKKVVEEWFKMMGGLRSILELGVAFLALANFCMTTSELMKKFMEFSKEKASSIAKFFESKIPTKTITKLMAPERRSKFLKQVALTILRLFAAFLLVLGIKLRRDIRREAQKKHEEMIQEMKKLRDNEIQLQDQRDIEARHLQREETANHDANL